MNRRKKIKSKMSINGVLILKSDELKYSIYVCAKA
jgi:hypothetical protein